MNKIIHFIFAVTIFLAMPALAQDPGRIYSARDGNCTFPHHGGVLQCGAGEYAVLDQRQVAASGYARVPNPDCAAGGSIDESFVSSAGQMYAAVRDYKNGQFVAGGLPAFLSIVSDDRVKKFIEDTFGGHVVSEFERWTGNVNTKTAQCQELCTLLPGSATVTGHGLMAINPSGIWLKCGVGGDDRCGKAWMSFPNPPTVKRLQSDGILACVIFKNWHNIWERTARYITFFEMPEKDKKLLANVR